jgi:hypothetical protein
MNKRKLQRAGKKKTADKANNSDQIMTFTAAQTAQAALQNKATLNCLGNFIFFSTESGEGWMLDHRKNCALKLAANGTIENYTILENKERFQVEWKERFRIEGEKFIASLKGVETVFHDYPVDAIAGLITMLEEKQNSSVQ